MWRIIGFILNLFCIAMLVFYALDGDDWLKEKINYQQEITK